MNTYTYKLMSYRFAGRTAAGPKTVRCCVRPGTSPGKQSHVFADPAGAGPGPGRAQAGPEPGLGRGRAGPRPGPKPGRGRGRGRNQLRFCWARLAPEAKHVIFCRAWHLLGKVSLHRKARRCSFVSKVPTFCSSPRVVHSVKTVARLCLISALVRARPLAKI